ncbi:MAG TPA: hypothetical protein VFO40_27915, partial [Chthoniobacterales bacterium]|nr:hypothetical protein [Chthoniobacterales bacterium]
MVYIWFVWVLGRLPHAFPYRSGAFLFQKIFERETLGFGVPTRITSKICLHPSTDARVKHVVMFRWAAVTQHESR